MSEGEGSLLDPDFLRRLARLRMLVQRRLAGSSAGARLTTRRGQSVEFADHRRYALGDDPRRIDWNAYARLGELVVRLYVAEEDLTLHLLVDSSASLGVGAPPKIRVAKKLAAALGYVALAGGDRVTVAPFGAGLGPASPPRRGRRGVGLFLRRLDRIGASGETDLHRTVEQFLAQKPRPGVVALFTDLFDPAGYRRPLERLVAARHEVVLFHVLDADELDPPASGDVAFVDSERGERVDLTLDSRVVAAYRRRLAAFLEDVESFAKRRGIRYVRVGGDVEPEQALLRYLGAA